MSLSLIFGWFFEQSLGVKMNFLCSPAQFELESRIEANETKQSEIKYYVGKVMEFYRSGDDGNFDNSIEKLEVI